MAEIEGLADLKLQLKTLQADLRRKVVRSALRDAAGPMNRAARANAPVLKKPATYRLPGTLKASIVTKASKRINGRNGEIGVYISVRKRKGLGGKASARNPFDPFYWRFMEFGFTTKTGKKRAIAGGTRSREIARKALINAGQARWIEGSHFMERAFDANTNSAIDIFKTRLKTRIDKANTRK
ncbi:MAG: HK97-gp10 family putative phage morphogenesis protein [Georgfuchsia sp.]